MKYKVSFKRYIDGKEFTVKTTLAPQFVSGYLILNKNENDAVAIPFDEIDGMISWTFTSLRKKTK